jgi:cytochrome b6-f complex iron-sulfur subunit
VGGEQSRRRFLQVAAGAAAAFVLAGCTSHKKAARATLTYPHGRAFGEKIAVGSLDAVLSSIDENHAPFYVPEARAYVSRFPAGEVPAAKARYPAALKPALDAGIVVIYQRCTHLGCRVPFCNSSQYFECPCHNAKFDRVGEYRGGPAPRGMDLMSATVTDGQLVIDTRAIVTGMPRGTNSTHQQPSGPFCVGSL